MKRGRFAEYSKGSVAERRARADLLRLFDARPLPHDELLANLGLFTRSLMVAKLLYLDELYRRIVPLPGVIMEFGVWWGSNLASFSALRAVYEPYNANRLVIGFDTFEGYQGHSHVDGCSEHLAFTAAGGYAVSPGYEEYLERVLAAHNAENVLPHLRKHELVRGNVLETVPAFFEEHPATVVALAYFDLALYQPTKACLEAIRPHLVRGSVLAIDELNSRDFPGETIAFREVLDLERYEIRRSAHMPDRSYLVIA